MKPQASADSWELPISTREGEFVARYTRAGLSSLNFPAAQPSARSRAAEPAPPSEIRGWHQLTVRAVGRVLDGQTPEALPPLDLSAGTQFQRQVWQVLLGIAPGQTRSYGEVARTMGRPKALRAVGQACGANPIPVLVPCHRVLAAGQRLGGFSAGLDWKRALLAREGIRLSA